MLDSANVAHEEEADHGPFDRDEELDSLLFDGQWPPITDVFDGHSQDIDRDVDADLLMLDDDDDDDDVEGLPYEQRDHGPLSHVRARQSSKERIQHIFENLTETLVQGNEELTLPIYTRPRIAGCQAKSGDRQARNPLCFPASTPSEAWKFSQTQC